MPVLFPLAQPCSLVSSGPLQPLYSLNLFHLCYSYLINLKYTCIFYDSEKNPLFRYLMQKIARLGRRSATLGSQYVLG